MRLSALKNSNAVMLAMAFAVLLSLLLSSCLPKPPATETGTRTITVYGFSVMKESLEKAIFPAFAAKWKQEHGEDVRFERASRIIDLDRPAGAPHKTLRDGAPMKNSGEENA